MRNWLLSLPLVCFLGLGCAAPAGDDAVVVVSAADGHVTTETSALRADAPFPTRVDIPIGASRAEICGRDDGDTKAAFRAHLAGRPLGTWQVENGVRVCRFCDLDGQTIDTYGGPIAIEDSTMANATLENGFIAGVRLKNVYARGVRVSYATMLGGGNADLRCAQGDSQTMLLIGSDDHRYNSAHGFDLAGSSGMNVILGNDVADVRLTGAELPGLMSNGAQLRDLRLDHVTTQQEILFTRPCVSFGRDMKCNAWSPSVLSGDLVLDRSPALKVRFDHLTLEDAKIRVAGAQGTIALTGDNTFERVHFDGLDGRVRLVGDLGSIHLSEGTSWPVGANGLVADADLAKVNLAGAVLTPPSGETWPAGPIDLSGLRLTHGGFVDGVDLSRAKLTGAKLERVSFRGVTLSRTERGVTTAADLENASLERARFDQQALDGVSFRGADLRGAVFALAKGTATFDRAKAGRLAAHTDDNDTDLPIDTSFDGAALGASTFIDAQLQYTTFRRAQLADVAFDRATADWADFSSARFFRVTEQKERISNKTLAASAGLHGASFDGADLRGVSLAGVDLSPGAGRAASLVGAFLCGADLSNAKLRGADLGGALFDVDGDVTFPDGTVGACTPGSRAGADTSSTTSATTSCPLRGEAPSGAGGQCSDAQWRVQGNPSCKSGSGRQRRNGAACNEACECQSLYCSPSGVCADAP